MGKFIVLCVFAFACCWGTLALFPGVTHHAFYLGSFSVSYLMLFGVGYIWVGSKLSGK
jgi:hypothetical protein